MIGLTNLEVYTSVVNITEQKNKFELYTDFCNVCTFMELRDELEETFNIEEVTPEHLQDDKIGALINKFFTKLKSENQTLMLIFYY